MRLTPIRPACLLFLYLLLSESIFGQNTQVGHKIYDESAKSVFVLYAVSPSGELVAEGSGFCIVGHKVVTNAHVANSGKIFIELGPARIPTKVEKIDEFNDLAVLDVNIEIVVKPLTLAEKEPSIGDSIYAIGNPEGLEKTISQGLVSGFREFERRRLLQITASISHGSSGGPVLDSAGDVVGVAVGAFRQDQNLNFAVPISLLRKLLAVNGGAAESNALATLAQVQHLSEKRGKESYSKDEGSPWQVDTSEIERLLRKSGCRNRCGAKSG